MPTTDPSSKKILMLSGFRIFPNYTGGHLRSSGIVRSLARLGHHVRVYSLAGRQGDYSATHLFSRRCYRIDRIEPRLCEETHLGLFYGLLQALGRRLGYPRVWQYRLLRRGTIPSRLKKALASADIILSDMPWCPRVPGPWSTKPWFLVSHNLEHLLLEQSNSKYRQYAEWMRDIEGHASDEFRDIFPCAEDDSQFFRANDSSGSLQLPLISCGVDPKSYLVPEGTREQVRERLGVGSHETLVLFSGSHFAPNIEALSVLKDFCRRNASFLNSERIKFLLLGSMCPIAFTDGVLIATGRVPEVASYFAAADAGLNPVTRGSGANVKLFEYVATRLPVISTSFGVRGTGLQPDLDYLPFEGDDLRTALQTFKRIRTRMQWHAYAEAVWQRHQVTFDIEQMVKHAIGQRVEFGASIAG